MKKIDALFLPNVSMPLTFGTHGKKCSFYWRYKDVNVYLPHRFFENNKPPFFCQTHDKMMQLSLEVFQQIIPALERIRKTRKSAMAEVFFGKYEKLVFFLWHKTHHVLAQPVCF